MPGFSAQGTVIAVSPDPNWPDYNPQGGTVAFTDIGELRDITPPALTRNAIETTTHNLSDDQYLVGIRRHGDMTFNVVFIPSGSVAGHDHLTGLQKKWFDGTRNIYRVRFPDTTAWIFSGFVTGFAPSAPVDDVLSADVTIRPTRGHLWTSVP